MNVVVYVNNSNKRSVHIGRALMEGIGKAGDKARMMDANSYVGPQAEVAVFYSLGGNLKRAFEEYVAAGRTAVVVDMGIWHRKKHNGDVRGYHKVSVNNLYAEHLLDGTDFPSDRFDRLGVEVMPRQRGGDTILLVGMSPKACWVHGLAYEEWERRAYRSIAMRTNRPVVYRVKKGCESKASDLTGLVSRHNDEPIEDALDKAKLAVCRHSNVAMDALVRGVPFTMERGVVKDCATSIDSIANPAFPGDDERMRALHRAAYAQWNVDEMESGEAWRFLRDRGYVG